MLISSQKVQGRGMNRNKPKTQLLIWAIYTVAVQTVHNINTNPLQEDFAIVCYNVDKHDLEIDLSFFVYLNQQGFEVLDYSSFTLILELILGLLATHYSPSSLSSLYFTGAKPQLLPRGFLFLSFFAHFQFKWKFIYFLLQLQNLT